MFDHVIIDVSDLEASRAFYERALAPLGISVVMEFEGTTAFGPQTDGRSSGWCHVALPPRPACMSP